LLLGLLASAPQAAAQPGPALEVRTARPRAHSAKARVEGVLNVNRASEAELRLLPGIGRGRAHAIVELGQGRLDRAQQRFAGRVQHDPAARPIEQLEAQLFLLCRPDGRDAATRGQKDFAAERAERRRKRLLVPPIGRDTRCVATQTPLRPPRSPR